MATDERQELFDTIRDGISDRKIRNAMSEEFRTLRKGLATALPADRPQIEARIVQLEKDTAIAARRPADAALYFYLVIALVVLSCFASLWAYFRGIGPDKYVLIEATRPVLVFTLIIAMLGFGGTLILRALFTQEPATDFEKRFRLAREVFLVYSGIFGTIIGFYFGAASGEAAAGQISLSAPFVREGGVVELSVEGGSPPFSGTIRLRGEDLDRSMVASNENLSIRLNPAQDCPAGALVKVTDGRGRATQRTIEQTALSFIPLRWAGCSDEVASDFRSADSNTANALDNAVVAAVPGNAAEVNAAAGSRR
jgi:hypothetical protein